MTRPAQDNSFSEWDPFACDPDDDALVTDGGQARPLAPPEAYSPQQVAAMLGRTPRTVRNWVKAGRLRRGGFGRAVYFSREAIEDFLNGQ